MNENKPSTPLGIGKRLIAAREALHLKEKDVATRLHLGLPMITMMETEDFANGMPVTFLRGYLRAYARLVDIPEPEIQAMLTHFESTQPTAPIITNPNLSLPALNSHTQGRYARWTTYAVALVLVGLVGMWWNSHARYDIADVPNKEASHPATAAAATTATSPTPPAPVTNPSANTPPSPPSEPVTPAPAANVATSPLQPPATPNTAINPNAVNQQPDVEVPLGDASKTSQQQTETQQAASPPATPEEYNMHSQNNQPQTAVPMEQQQQQQQYNDGNNYTPNTDDY